MHRYIFHIGRATDLCALELNLLLSRFSPTLEHADQHVLIFNFPQEIPVADILATSGGVIKIAQALETISTDKFTLESSFVNYLSDYMEQFVPDKGKIRFGLSWYGASLGVSLRDLTISLKEQLGERKRSSQFFLGDNNELSSVQVAKEHLLGDKGVELLFVRHGENVFVGRTLGVQDFERWSDIDYGRPGRDPKSGMLPPKVARMMVNIGLCSYLDSNNATPTVFDPFCGSGTVLTEALQLGCNVKGSDSSDKAITDTRANIEWLIQSNLAKLDHTVYTFPKAAAEPELFVSESVHVTKVVGQSTIDVIVTEPYMGPTFLEDPTPGKRERIMKGLEKLYIGTLKELYRALKPGGVLVFAEPEYFMEGKSFKIGIIDKYADFGYTKSCNFVSYKRDRSFVGRRIAILKKV